MKKLLFTFLIGALLLTASAQVPKTLSFQGYLVDQSGDAVTASPDMTFSIWDALSGGTQLWTEIHSAVPVSKGLYNVLLGDAGTPVNLAFDKVYYLQVKVGLETLIPRITVSSSAYSINSVNASTITAGTLNGALVGPGVNASTITTGAISNSLLDTDLQDLADGSLSGSLIGSGISASNITTGTLSGSIIGSGISATNITTGTLSGGLVGNGINASNLSAGTIADARLETTVDINSLNVGTAGQFSLSNAGNITRINNVTYSFPAAQGAANAVLSNNGSGTLSWTGSLSGSGAANQISYWNGTSSFTGSAGLTWNNASSTLSATNFAGNGSGLTALPAASITGANALPTSVLPTSVALGNGANGRASFWTGSGTVSSNANFAWDNSNGRLGIGTSAPQVTMHVNGNSLSEALRIESNTDPLISFYGASTYRGFLQTSGADMVLGTSSGSAGNLILFANGNTGMIMTSARLVGLSRTPSANRLEVNGVSSQTTAGSWLANSDRRIKTDIQDLESSIDVIKKLHPVRFKYTEEWKKRNPSIQDHYYYNYIAQEFREVFPDAVKGSGEYLAGDPNEILQIDTYNAQIVIVKAFQELISKVETIQQENSKLRSELDEVKHQLNFEAKHTTH